MSNQIKTTNNDLNYTFTLSQISHEINNPLTLIYSTIQLLALKYPELNKDKLWSQLLSDVNYLKELTLSLSSFNHSDQLNLQSVPLKELLMDLTASWQSVAQQENKKLLVHISETLPSVHCDPVKLKECIINLLKNSFEATHDSDTIEVTAVASDQNVSISITDTGKGMDKSQLQHIFEPFTSYKSNGTGLGLCITERIIKAHHGTILVTSIPHKHTSFLITLPICQS